MGVEESDGERQSAGRMTAGTGEGEAEAAVDGQERDDAGASRLWKRSRGMRWRFDQSDRAHRRPRTERLVPRP